MGNKAFKIAIIGAGNMGGAIASGLAMHSDVFKTSIYVSDVSSEKLAEITKHSPNVQTSTSNKEIIQGAGVIIMAVKPWLIPVVADEIKGSIDFKKQLIVSIAAGVNLAELHNMLHADAIIYRAIPNTAVEVLEGVTAISTNKSNEKNDAIIEDLFSRLGEAFLVPESQLNAYMSLASCGIAYAFRYIRAAMQGAVEMGIPSNRALEVIMQTMQGAVAVLSDKGSHPEEEIDRVTTPGGITIKGLNAMEAHGFSNAVVQGLKASLIANN